MNEILQEIKPKDYYGEKYYRVYRSSCGTMEGIERIWIGDYSSMTTGMADIVTGIISTNQKFYKFELSK